MSDDRYLWDKSGTKDPEVERLEKALASLGHDEAPLTLPETAAPTRPRPREIERRPRPWIVPFGVAAATALAASVAVVALIGLRAPRGWEVRALSGAPRVGGRALEERARIRGGDSLVTDAGSTAWIRVGKIGVVEVGPGSRLRVIGTRAPDHRLALDRGSLEAKILAPPRQFTVETPSGAAVDLGCVYDLEVDGVGDATLTVVAGWVSFERDGRETFVPAGARCATRGGSGAGTPYFTDASPGFKNALAELDLTPATRAADPAILDAALAGARREDAFSLWHLLLRLHGADRERLVDRLADLIAMPAGVTRAGAIAGDSTMLDRWWDALGFGPTSDWRRWKGPWPGESR
jgi:hypothetical protein